MPISNGSFVMPSIASDGIQVIEVMDDSARTRRQSALWRRRRQKVSAPAMPARVTASSDLFGRPPSTDGIAPFALGLMTRLPIFQTLQPRTALRRLTIDTPGVLAATW